MFFSKAVRNYNRNKIKSVKPMAITNCNPLLQAKMLDSKSKNLLEVIHIYTKIRIQAPMLFIYALV